MAKVFLARNTVFTVSPNFNAEIVGSDGIETIILSESSIVTIDRNVERIEFTGKSSDYNYIVAGNIVTVSDKKNLAVATLTVDAYKTLAFTDGSTQLVLTGLNAANLGGKLISGVTATSLEPILDISDKSGAKTQAPILPKITDLSSSNLNGFGTLGVDTFNVTSGTYTATINGFSSGDKLSFFANSSSSIVNASAQDGTIQIKVSNGSNGNVATINLIGLTSLQDASIFNISSFNSVFGVGAISDALSQTSNLLAPIDLGIVNGINLHLINPIISNGKTYYVLDTSGNNLSGGEDRIDHNQLDFLLNGGSDTTDNFRSTVVNGYKITLPSRAELLALASDMNSHPLGSLPSGWSDISGYWTSSQVSQNIHEYLNLSVRGGGPNDDLVYPNLVAFEVDPVGSTGNSINSIKIPPIVFSTQNTLMVESSPYYVVVGDFNNDGNKDLATANVMGISVLLGNGKGDFTSQRSFNLSGRPRSISLGDFNSDGNIDLVSANEDGNNVSLLLGDGKGNFYAQSNFSVNTRPVAIQVADFNSDGKLDLVTSNSERNPSGNGNVSVLLGDGKGHFSEQTTFQVGVAPEAINVADFNSDGKIDIVTANWTSSNVSILLGDGKGQFLPQTNFTVRAGGPSSVDRGDFNNDGNIDLVTSNWGNDNISILLGNGNGSFSQPVNFDVGIRPRSVCVSDFNFDGKLDLAVANETGGNISLLQGNGDGSFNAQTTFIVGKGTWGINLGDFNSDGKIDVVTTANQGTNGLSVLLNTTEINSKSPSTQLPPTGTLSISGTPQKNQILLASNTIADVNGLGAINYQWFSNGAVISGATQTSYTVTQTDVGKIITVKASYTDGLGKLESLTSAGIPVVANSQISINSPTVNEGDSGQTNLTFILTLSQALQQTGSVDYTVQSGTATTGVDFSAISGTVQFNAGETSKTITVSALGDALIEGDENFNLVLSNPRNIELSSGSTTLTGIGTIRNDDFPTLTFINTPSVQEGNSGQSALVFTIKLSEVALSDLSVDYATQSATATAGQDFTAQTGTLKFAVGDKEKTISIPILGDATDETDETLMLIVNNPKNVKFTGNATELRSTGTILNDDGQSIRLSSPSITEGDNGISLMKFVLSIDNAVSNAVNFDYKTEEDTALADVDYANTFGTVVLPAGDKSVDITVPISNDLRIETNETFKLVVSNAKGITFTNNSLPITGIGTIVDNDFPIISVPNTKILYEPTVGFKRWDIPVTLSTSASIDSVISYHTQSGSAIQDKDFLTSSGKITIPANADAGVISVPIIADTEKEPDETFSLIIDGIEGGAKLPVGQTSLHTDITISSNSIPALAVQNAELIEGDTGNKNLVFKVNLSSPSTQAVSFTVKTVDKTASAGSDYQAINVTTKTIPVGGQSLEILVPILGDKNAEGDEVFNLELSKISNAVFDNGVDTLIVKGTILDDDKPIIRIEDAHVVEGNTGIHDAKIKVTLSTPAANPVTLHYKSIDGTAKAGEDFIAAEDDLIIPKGAAEGFIPVSIQGDTSPESAQNFNLVLSSLVNAQFIGLATSIQNIVTIDSDDGDSLPIVTVNKNLAIDEGDSGLTDFPVTLKLSSPATDTLTIQYKTIAVDARANSDFITDTRTLTFLAGDTSQTIHLSVYGDVEPESDEDFTLALTDPQGMRFSDGLPSQDVTLLIRDDDSEPPQKLEGTAKNDILDATKLGGTGDDTLDGLKGIDTMIGGDGNDTYFVDNIKDSIIEGDQSQSNAGDDDLVHSTATAYTLPVNVEHLIIDGKAKGNGTGNVLDNKLIGNLAVNVLSGLAGNDTLDGGSGNDTLTGGDGSDTFIFSSGIKGNKNIDTVKDFVHGQDKIYLSADIFSKLATAAGFVTGSEPLSLAKVDSHYLVSAVKVKAVDVSNYLLYDTKTGVLAYDEDGIGKLVASSFVSLTGKPSLTLEDFWIL